MASMKLVKLGVLTILVTSVGTANCLFNFHFHVAFGTLAEPGKVTAAIFGAYDKDGAGWTVTRNLSRLTILGRTSFSVLNKRFMYPCRLTAAQREKPSDRFLLRSLRLTVSESFTEPQFDSKAESVEINQCN